MRETKRCGSCRAVAALDELTWVKMLPGKCFVLACPSCAKIAASVNAAIEQQREDDARERTKG
jgi:4-hydroxy-3-methylbut-2-en-1-yl diphosphate synthase IspG/GcpE